MKKLRLTALPLCLIALCGAASSSSAAVRYASPSVGTGNPCSEAAPCTLKEAINTPSGSPFSVAMLPGTYGSEADPITNLGSGARSDTEVAPLDSAQRPLVYLSSSGVSQGLILQSGVVSDIDFRLIGSPDLTYGVFSQTMNRVSVVGPARTTACTGDTISNTLCASTFDGASGFDYSISAGGPISRTVSLTNVTAWSGPGGGHGVNLHAGENTALTVNIKNSIVHGSAAGKDINLVNNDGVGATSVVNIANSNFATYDISGIEASISSNSSNGNQSAAPLLVNPAAADFRQAAGSPTIDAGDAAAAVGALDVLGAARVLGATVDIGASEYVPPATTPVAPKLSSFKRSKKKYKAAKSGKAFQPAKNASRRSNKGRGTIVSFSLTGEGSVHFRIFRQIKKSGKKSWKLVNGVETVTGLPGSNKFWFSGRWGKKTLPAGTYLLKGTPTVKGSTIRPTTGDEPGTSKGLTSSIVK